MSDAIPLHQRLVDDVGISRVYAYQLASGSRPPSLPLALKIRAKVGVSLGPIAGLSDEEIAALEGMIKRGAKIRLPARGRAA